MKKGKLLLIPVPLGEGAIENSLVPGLQAAIAEMDEFIVENGKTARRFLKQMGIRTPMNELRLHVYDKHSDNAAIDDYLKPVLQGKDVGLLSEAGCPAVADPGALIVRRAHEKNIRVVPYVGPSSIILSLMASGFNGQQFAFQGYLPIPRPERIRKIQELERASRKLRQTQIFIETPFRNNQLLEDLLGACHATASLSISCDLTTDTEFIATRRIAEWKSQPHPDLHKRPAVFLLYAGD
ncbi:16S rRNA (cytidine1402-2'-O)-methyltransferase [Anseongella ginsenosidimutans]|uniref:16S rRNA (Cytidine1402-2'-O)-methyltransferase n=1 Tax=Anseongella ginsenosidimutans TaxID=496056 RepID=A0A4R3KNQ5_9SPHI|nr:SAM-dependent methyltransferase [Anseongella ginsenosidimutans]QEC52011.1 SAM-dependent methyltransferase [Anseongella ginsenosidimutans]TCS85689.1 16S rRNA (cytidine1402-2'-O)-methyltransferase [Anseongella ginsenosidimutans]